MRAAVVVLGVMALVGCEQRETPAAAAAPKAAAAPPPSDEVPDRFRGEWNMRLADCGTDMNDSRLVIGAREIRFYETSGPVVRVARPAPGEVAVTVALSGEGEGPENSTHRFRISPDGAELSMVGEGAPLLRRRCPAA